jgi:hypothetical protein
MKKMIFALAAIALSASAFAQDLTINGAEFGIGKFHRKDNKVQPYESNNVWKPFILPNNVKSNAGYVQKNSETNYTIFFTNLDEFLAEVIKLTKTTGKKVAILNINAHGLPGGMWFPKDAATRDSAECKDWRNTSFSSDDSNYDPYYSLPSKEEVVQFQQMGSASGIPSYECLTGLNEWTAVAKARPEIKTAFAEKAQIHMLSCIVGLGTLGDKFTKGLANLLLTSGKVQTSIKFGLGDFSMAEGMGFWDYESDDQLERDAQRYPTHRRDSEVAQKGDIRVAVKDDSGTRSGLIRDVEYMYLVKDNRAVTMTRKTPNMKMSIKAPQSVRVPGTNAVVELK